MPLEMKNLSQVSNDMINAMRAEDTEAYQTAFEKMADVIAQNVLAEARQSNDTAILAQRGVRQLTSEEKKFYEAWSAIVASGNPKQALTGGEVSFPQTIINAVFDDIRESHPLLAEINFQNTGGALRYLISRSGRPTATWGELTAQITQEITLDIQEVDMTLKMLSAFIPVSKAIIDLGAEWLDRYIRSFLAEAIANGLENAIINGLNSTSPIGMIADLSTGTVDQDTGVVSYTAKTAVAVTELSPKTIGTQLATLAVGPNGQSRPVSDVILVCNPADYFSKVAPATMVLASDGVYVDKMPFGVKVITSPAVASGKAVLGLAKRYFMGIGFSGSAGTIEFSDQYKFVEHKRYYKTYLYGNGMPSDNNCFVYLNIANLGEKAIKTKAVQ